MSRASVQPGNAVSEARRAWEALLSSQDREVIARTAYGQFQGWGERPALVLVDFQYAYLGLDEPILDQLDKWPTAGGDGAWRALRTVLPVVATARSAGVPVICSRIGYPPEEALTNPFSTKRGAGGLFVLGGEGTELPEELRLREGEILLTKTGASAFYGTDLEQVLARKGVDTLLVAGVSTSGCIRATVVDSAARGFRTIVIADGVADRIELSHCVTLFDIWMKYGDLVTAAEAVDHLASLSNNDMRRD